MGCNIDEISRADLHQKVKWLTVKQRIYIRSAMILHNSLYSGKPLTIYEQLHRFDIPHDYNTRFSLKSKKDDRLLKKPICKKKTFLARSFISRAIDIWNNLDLQTRLIETKDRFKSTLLKQISWFI